MRFLWKLCRGALLALILSIGSSLSAQQEITLVEGCEGCRIVFDTIAVLGDQEGPGLIEREENLIEVDAEGRHHVIGRPASEIKVFSSDGTWLRTIGRAGEGPGEFRAAQALHIDGRGRLFVADGMLFRMSVFGADGSFDRTIPIRGVTPGFELFPLPGDSILLSGYGATPEIFGKSLHVVSPVGEIARSFGEPPHSITSGDPFALLRTAAPHGTDHVWVAGWDRYRIELWSIGGERLRSFVMDSPWFEGVEASDEGPRPPRAALGSIREDSDGFLWIHLYVPRDDWREGERLDTVIEVMDPSRGRWVASERLPGRWTNIFGERLIGHPSLDLEEASFQIYVLRMRVDGM